MYYDDINATAGLLNQDLTITVAIYRKGGINANTLVTSVDLTRDEDIGFIKYNYNECTEFNQSKVRTRLFTYTKDIFLDPTVFNDPGGYYVVWERCCRNAVITNIQNPDNTGNAFYLEFPPVVIGGNRFLNSTPLFQPITGDFPCLGQPFTFPFGAFDPDGDSLTYTLVRPYAGWSGPNVGNNNNSEPFPHPAPYPTITWRTGYSDANQIPGAPALTVDDEGVLHVKPTQLGLFAFALRVDEYRSGVLIGSVRRDFQFTVINCPLYPGPIIGLDKPGGGVYVNGDTLNLKVETDTCFTVFISDSSTTERNLSIRTIKTNIPPSIISINRSFQAKLGVFLRTPLCFDACRKLNIDHDSVFYIEIIVQDEQCPAPKTDTLRLSIAYKPQVNAKPQIVLDTVSFPFTRYLMVGDQLQFHVIGTDSNTADILTMSASGKGFNLSDLGMVFPTTVGSDSIVGPFSWTVPCEALGLGVFKLDFIVKDNSCIVNNEDTVSVTLYVRDTVTNIENFEPPNLVTPNGDQKNDFFELVNLPIDNCDSYFAGAFIYNRWGAKVFESYKRDFKWDPSSFSDGLYYYLVDFHSRKVKGWLQIVK
jgi:hypothetical protein